MAGLATYDCQLMAGGTVTKTEESKVLFPVFEISEPEEFSARQNFEIDPRES